MCCRSSAEPHNYSNSNFLALSDPWLSNGCFSCAILYSTYLLLVPLVYKIAHKILRLARRVMFAVLITLPCVVYVTGRVLALGVLRNTVLLRAVLRGRSAAGHGGRPGGLPGADATTGDQTGDGRGHVADTVRRIPGVRYDAAEDVGGGAVRHCVARRSHHRRHRLRHRVPALTLAAGKHVLV